MNTHGITKELFIELRKQARQKDVDARIGKMGLTQQAVEQLDRMIKKKKLVKVKLLKPSFDGGSKQEVIDKLLEKTGALLIDKVGFTVTVYRK